MKTPPGGRADEGPVLPRRAGLARAPLRKKFLNFNEISKYSAERLSMLAHRRADIHRLGVIASGPPTRLWRGVRIGPTLQARNAQIDPIDDAVVDALSQSIEEDGFWGS
jgi:hypothetical protein